MSYSEYWQCPKCRSLLKKGGNLPGMELLRTAVIFRSGNCPNCGAEFPPEDIYEGRYDVEVISFEPCVIRQIGPGLKRNNLDLIILILVIVFFLAIGGIAGWFLVSLICGKLMPALSLPSIAAAIIGGIVATVIGLVILLKGGK